MYKDSFRDTVEAVWRGLESLGSAVGSLFWTSR